MASARENTLPDRRRFFLFSVFMLFMVIMGILLFPLPGRAILIQILW